MEKGGWSLVSREEFKDGRFSVGSLWGLVNVMDTSLKKTWWPQAPEVRSQAALGCQPLQDNLSGKGLLKVTPFQGHPTSSD